MNTAWPVSAVALAGVFWSAALAAPLAAQDQQAPPNLEDLIPDSALDNPDDWAQQTEPAPEAVNAADPVIDDLDAEMAEIPAIELAWPDDLEIEPVDPVEPDEDVRFADLEVDAPVTDFAEAERVRISDELVLAFPQREPPFSERGDFLARFEALSTIEELDSDDDNIALLSARAREDQELLERLLRIYGYYDAQVIRTLARAGDGNGEDAGPENNEVRFDILPGRRYTFGEVNLGSLAQAPDHEDLRRVFEIQPGDPLSSDKIVEERFDLDRALGESGYVFASIDEPSLLVDHEREAGDLTLNVEPNGKYEFARITSTDPKFLSARHLQTIARFEPGDTYQRSLELDLRRAVVATGLVSDVTITPREVTAPSGEEPGQVAMDVALTRAPLRTIAGAIGYGSEEGVRVQASWEHRNLFPPEGAFRVRGIVGTQEQLLGVTLRRNNFGGRDRILNADAFVSTLDNDAFEANTASAIVTYERVSTLLFQKPLSWSLGIELVATDERPAPVEGVAQPRETFFVAAFPGYALVDTTDDLLDPTQGFRLGARFSPEISRSEGTQSYYVRTQVDASYYNAVTDGVVLAGRARFGSIPGTTLNNIAPSRRFYAGGGGSVRGYGYRQIGPSDALGEPNGGRSLVELSAEARIRTGFLDGAVSVVPFVDAGSVGPDPTPDFKSIKFGAGIGVRYHTGFGPLRLDVGVPLNPGPDDNPVAVYVSLGQAF